jgi:hypothetical protein
MLGGTRFASQRMLDHMNLASSTSTAEPKVRANGSRSASLRLV